MIVQDYSGGCVAVFEVKYAKSQEGLAQSWAEAIAQIEDKKRCLVQLKVMDK